MKSKIKDTYPELHHHYKKMIGLRIAQRRIILGLSQQALGNIISKSKDTVSKYERGVSPVPAPDLLILAKALDRDVSYFLRDLENIINPKENTEAEEIKENIMKVTPKKLQTVIARSIREIAEMKLKEEEVS